MALAVRMMRTAISPRLATRIVRKAVIPGLVPGIQASVGDWGTWSWSQLLDLRYPGGLALLDEGADAFAGIARQGGCKRVRGRIEGGAERLAHRGAHQLLGLGDGLRRAAQH